MEKGTKTPLEARMEAFLDEELRKIAKKLKKTEGSDSGIAAKGAINRKQQALHHLEQEQTGLINARSFVLDALAKRQSSETSSIGDYFSQRIEEIDTEFEETNLNAPSVTFEGTLILGKKQKLKHLRTFRMEMFRIANHILNSLGGPLLIDNRNSADEIQPPQLAPESG